MSFIRLQKSVRSVLALDNVNTTFGQSLRPSTRRLVQLYAALLFNAHLKGFVEGEIYTGKTKYACVPGFNCYSCPAAVGACPLGAIQNALASSGHRAGWYVLGIILLYGVILGRTLCGWLCPLGLIQELLHKIPTPKIRKGRLTRALSWLKYPVLGVFVVALPLLYGLQHDLPLPAFCKYICPAGTFEGAIGLLSNPANAGKFSMLGILFTRKFSIMLIIGLACIFCYRSFCRFLCPLGAIFGLFNRFNLIGVKVDTARCKHCGACVRSCGMDVRRVGDHECINCARCMDSCSQKAISFRAGRVTLKAPEGGCADDTPAAPTRRRRLAAIVWSAALALLCFALLWYNVLDPSIQKKPAARSDAATTEILAPEETKPAEPKDAGAEADIHEEKTEPADSEAKTAAPEETLPAEAENDTSDAPIGSQPGMQLEDFSIICLDGTEFHLADYRGKVVFLNLWATYCTPCVQELPYFSRLYEEHEDDIAMLAVHSSLTTDDPTAYVADKGWLMPMAIDTDDDLVYDIVGGSSTLPQTIVLNRRGEVIYNEVRSVTPEMLEALYEQAKNGSPADRDKK